MTYRLANGAEIDTARQCTFEERNFLQKMMIYARLDQDREAFAARWRRPGNPVWQGPETLESPGPAAAILLDLEEGLGRRAEAGSQE